MRAGLEKTSGATFPVLHVPGERIPKRALEPSQKNVRLCAPVRSSSAEKNVGLPLLRVFPGRHGRGKNAHFFPATTELTREALPSLQTGFVTPVPGPIQLDVPITVALLRGLTACACYYPSPWRATKSAPHTPCPSFCRWLGCPPQSFTPGSVGWTLHLWGGGREGERAHRSASSASVEHWRALKQYGGPGYKCATQGGRKGDNKYVLG